MTEVEGQQSFQLATESEKEERNPRDRILTTHSPVFKTPNDNQNTFGIVTGKNGYWVRPTGKFGDLTRIRALENIDIVSPTKVPEIVELGTTLFTPRNRIINPAAKRTPKRSR